MAGRYAYSVSKLLSCAVKRACIPAARISCVAAASRAFPVIATSSVLHRAFSGDCKPSGSCASGCPSAKRSACASGQVQGGCPSASSCSTSKPQESKPVHKLGPFANMFLAFVASSGSAWIPNSDLDTFPDGSFVLRAKKDEGGEFEVCGTVKGKQMVVEVHSGGVSHAIAAVNIEESSEGRWAAEIEGPRVAEDVLRRVNSVPL